MLRREKDKSRETGMKGERAWGNRRRRRDDEEREE